ncbi:MAG: hypothetical protein AAB727_00055 [Patescibacteria group bacterium]
MKKLVSVCATLGFLLGFLLFSAPSFAAEAWEYKAMDMAEFHNTVWEMTAERLSGVSRVKTPEGTVSRKETALQSFNEKLDALGEEGWEFVGIYSGLAIFKRKKNQ